MLRAALALLDSWPQEARRLLKGAHALLEPAQTDNVVVMRQPG